MGPTDSGDTMAHRLDRFMRAVKPTTEEEGSFYHVVTAIAGFAIPNYWMMRDAHSQDQQYRVAWGCRNMLELAVFAEFVLASEKNCREFAEDRLFDGHQIARMLFTMEEWVGGASHAQNVVGPLIKEHEDMMKAAQITRTSYHRVADIATGELKKEFGTVHKLSSKLVHPTAWSLLTAYQGNTRFPEASEILFTFGLKYFMMIGDAFMSHIRKYGLRPKA
jgi:hypothetical protein